MSRRGGDDYFVLYHAGVGWLAAGVSGPIEVSSLYGAAVEVKYHATDDVRISASVVDALRFNFVHGAQIHALAAELNKKEQHHRWRAMTWRAACEVAK